MKRKQKNIFTSIKNKLLDWSNIIIKNSKNIIMIIFIIIETGSIEKTIFLLLPLSSATNLLIATGKPN